MRQQGDGRAEGRVVADGRGLRVAVAVLLVAATFKLATHESAAVPARALAATEASPVTPLTEPATTVATTVPPPPSTTVAPPAPPPRTPATKAAPPSTTSPPPPPVAHLNPPAVPAGIAAYRGLGTWLDVYDWSMAYTGGQPTASVADVDRMAEVGVQTLYIQASKHDSPTDIVEPDTLQSYIDRAKGRGLQVVVWYLPTLVDVGRDLQRLRAIAGLAGIDGLAVDIESRAVGDLGERSRRLVELSTALRQALPGRAIGAIMLPPVVMDVINPAFWPDFPYRQIAPAYDVWMTMGYWTNRKADSGYRDAYRYTRENVERLRSHLGQPDLAVHPIGGIANGTGGDDVEGFKRAVAETGGIGGSLYDWRTTADGLWPALRGFRRG